MGKRILFLTGSNKKDTWMWKIYRELNRYEKIIPHFIATSEKNYDILCSLGVPSEDISKIFAFQKKSKPNLMYLQECEEKYKFNIWDAWSVSAVRKKSRAKLDPKEILGYLQYTLKKIETIINKFKPDYFICYGTAGFHSVTFHKVLRQNKVKIIELGQSVISNRFTILGDLSNVSPLLKSTYKTIKKDGLSEKDKEKAEQFIKDFQNKPKKQDRVKKFKEPINNKIKRVFSYGYQVLRYRKLPPKLRFVFWPIIQKTYDYLGFFEKPKQNEKYVLFPLHFQPEAATLIYGKWYVDQLPLIENISKSIPVSHMLYVKEHPFGYGNRNLSFYKRIKKLPNVRLLSPHENNFKLIKNCSLLITITGTAGWEAMLFQIPVITFGNIFYNICEETTKLTNIEELPQVIRNKLNQKINYNTLVEFVAAMFKCSYSGLTILPSDCNDYSLKDGNIKLLAKGIMDHIQKQNYEL